LQKVRNDNAIIIINIAVTFSPAYTIIANSIGIVYENLSFLYDHKNADASHGIYTKLWNVKCPILKCEIKYPEKVYTIAPNNLHIKLFISSCLKRENIPNMLIIDKTTSETRIANHWLFISKEKNCGTLTNIFWGCAHSGKPPPIYELNSGNSLKYKNDILPARR